MGLDVIVSKPEHHGSGRTKYTDFLVESTISTDVKSFVRRKEEDFIFLRAKLVEERLGGIIPQIQVDSNPPPAKIKFSDEYVQERQEYLEQWLKRIMRHPELIDAPSLQAFVTRGDKDWEALKVQPIRNVGSVDIDDEDNKKPYEPKHWTDEDYETGGGGDSIVISAQETPTAKKKGRFGQWLQNTRTRMALRSTNLQLEETPADQKKFQDMQDYAEKLETCVLVLVEDSKLYLEAQMAQSERLTTMGAAFTELSVLNSSESTEPTNDSIAARMYQTLGNTWAEVAKICEIQQIRGVQKFSTPFQQLLLDTTAFKEALLQRKEILYLYTNKYNEAHAKQVQIDKLKSKANLDQERYVLLENEMKILDIETGTLRKRVETASSRLEREFPRFRIEFHEELRSILDGHHSSQWGFTDKQSQSWKSTLHVLEDGVLKKNEVPTNVALHVPVEPEDPLALTVSVSLVGVTTTFDASGNHRNDGKDEEIAQPPAAAPPPPPVTPVDDDL